VPPSTAGEGGGPFRTQLGLPTTLGVVTTLGVLATPLALAIGVFSAQSRADDVRSAGGSRGTGVVAQVTELRCAATTIASSTVCPTSRLPLVLGPDSRPTPAGSVLVDVGTESPNCFCVVERKPNTSVEGLVRRSERAGIELGEPAEGCCRQNEEVRNLAASIDITTKRSNVGDRRRNCRDLDCHSWRSN
jgi:hypothetical protein